MPTWAISAPGRSGSPGSRVVFPSLVLNYAGQAALVLDGAPTDGNIFYRPVPARAADAAGGAGDGRHHHRQPVDHHRRVLDDAAGDPARLVAPAGDHGLFSHRTVGTAAAAVGGPSAVQVPRAVGANRPLRTNKNGQWRQSYFAASLVVHRSGPNALRQRTPTLQTPR